MIHINCLLLLAFLALPIKSKTKDDAITYSNSVTVNGHPLNVETLALYSRGVLAVVAGDLSSSKHKPLLFRVLLRRAGKDIQKWPANPTKGTYSVQLDEIWPFAQFCDELVVEPISSPAQPGTYDRYKRVIKVANINWFAQGNC